MEWVQFESKNKELLKFSNIPSILKGKKLNNSSKKLKVSANPLGLLAENRSNKKAWFKYSHIFLIHHGSYELVFRSWGLE